MRIQSTTKRALLWGFIGSVGVAAILGVGALLTGRFGTFEFKVLMTALTVTGSSLLGLAAAAAMEARRWPPLGVVALVAVGLCAIATLLMVWDVLSQKDVVVKALGSACIIAVALAHTSLLAMARLRANHEVVRYVTVGLIALLVCVLIGAITEVFQAGEGTARFIGILAILASCGSITVPVLHRIAGIEKREIAVNPVSASRRVEMKCPRCGGEHRAALGRSRCAACGLGIDVQIEEEHCPACGYVIYGLTVARCPECGRELGPKS